MAKIRDLPRDILNDRLTRAIESGKERRIYDAQKDVLGWELIYTELTPNERTTKHRLLSQLVRQIAAHDRAEHQRVETGAGAEPVTAEPQEDPRAAAQADRAARRAGLSVVS